MSCLGPKIELLLLKPTRPGNPYEWNLLHRGDCTLHIPSMQYGGGYYLFTDNGGAYDLIEVRPDTTIEKLEHLPFTHWFSKPISTDSHRPNHWNPIRMSHGKEYLVRIRDRLKYDYKWRFISDVSILRDCLPIDAWIDDDDLFPITPLI